MSWYGSYNLFNLSSYDMQNRSYRTKTEFIKLVSELDPQIPYYTVLSRAKKNRDIVYSFYQKWVISGSDDEVKKARKIIDKSLMGFRSKKEFAELIGKLKPSISFWTIYKKFFSIKEISEGENSPYQRWRISGSDDEVKKARKIIDKNIGRTDTPESIDTSSNKKSDSMLEVVFRDVFFITRLPLEYFNLSLSAVPEYKKLDEIIKNRARAYFGSKSKGFYTIDSIKPDFVSKDGGFFFEIFGDNRDDYEDKMWFKIVELAGVIPIKYVRPKGTYTLLSAARYVDKNTKIANEDRPVELIPGVNIEKALQEKEELLKKYGIELSSTYKPKLEALTSSQKDSLRKDVEKYPIIEFPKQPQPLPKAVAQTRENIITMSMIEMSLAQTYQSVQYWTDEEKIAVYFHTEDRLQQELDKLDRLIQQIEDQSLPKAAKSNWYVKSSSEEESYGIEDPILDDPDRNRQDEPIDIRKLQTDEETGKRVSFIKPEHVRRVLDRFIVDQLNSTTISNRFSIQYDGENGSELIEAMRMVNSPYTTYPISKDERSLLLPIIRDGSKESVDGLREFLVSNPDKMRKIQKTPRPRRPFDPNRSRYRTIPITRMQEIRDAHGLIGIYDLKAAREISARVTRDFASFDAKQLEFIKRIALTDAYRNIYPEKVTVIKGNNKIWKVSSWLYDLAKREGIDPLWE